MAIIENGDSFHGVKLDWTAYLDNSKFMPSSKPISSFPHTISIITFEIGWIMDSCPYYFMKIPSLVDNRAAQLELVECVSERSVGTHGDCVLALCERFVLFCV